MEPAVIQHASVPVHRPLRLHIHFQTAANHIGVGHGQLQLVRCQFLFHIPPQQLHLHGILVRHPKMPHLPAPLQLVKRLRHFLRLNQRVRAVQQQYIQILRPQTFQALLHRFQNMLLRAVIHFPGDNAALGLENHILPLHAGLRHRLSKQLLAGSPAIDIRMVKEVRPHLKRPVNPLRHLGAPHLVNSHTPHSNRRHGKPAPAQFDMLHQSLLLLCLKTLSIKDITSSLTFP